MSSDNEDQLPAVTLPTVTDRKKGREGKVRYLDEQYGGGFGKSAGGTSGNKKAKKESHVRGYNDKDLKSARTIYTGEVEDPVNSIHLYRDPVPGLLQNLKNHEKHQKQSSKYYNLIVRAGFEEGHVILFESHVLGPNNGLWGVAPKDVLTVLHLGITRESFKTLWKKRSVPAQQKSNDQNKDGPKGSYLMFNMHTGLPGGDFEAKDGGNYSFVEPAKHEEKSTITSQVFDPVTRAILQNFEANLIRALKDLLSRDPTRAGRSFRRSRGRRRSEAVRRCRR